MVVKSVKKLSKSRRIVKKPEKHQKPEKLKDHRFGGTFTKTPIFRQLDTRTQASIRVLIVFRTLFAKPKKLSQSHFRFNYQQSTANRAAAAFSITNKAKLVNLLMLRYVFSPEKPKDLRVENTQVFHQS